MHNDKIFNNTYGEHDSLDNSSAFTFSLSELEHAEPDERMHYDILMCRVDELIKGSEFEHFNEMTPDGVIKKLNKVQINKVFFYIIEKLGSSYSRIDIFGVLSDYFDVFPNKFYNSLSNKFKDDLIKELDDKYNILEKRKIRKLF